MTDKTKTPVYVPSKEDWEEFAKWEASTPEAKILPLPEEERKALSRGLVTDRKFILPKRGG